MACFLLLHTDSISLGVHSVDCGILDLCAEEERRVTFQTKCSLILMENGKNELWTLFYFSHTVCETIA